MKDYFEIPLTDNQIVKNKSQKVLYDNFEVHRVVEFDDYHGGTFCEQADDDSDIGMKSEEDIVNIFYTVYGHCPKGGVEAVSDFNSRTMAQELCDFLNSLLDKADIGTVYRKV